MITWRYNTSEKENTTKSRDTWLARAYARAKKRLGKKVEVGPGEVVADLLYSQRV